MDVAGSRRHIDKQHVEFSPAYLQDHLLEGGAGHGTAPDERLFGLCEISDGHPFDAEFFHGKEDLLAVVGELLVRSERGSVGFIDLDAGGDAFCAGHLGHGGAVNVGIRQSHAVTETRKGHGQVDGDGGFAHSSLSGGYADDFTYIFDQIIVEIQNRSLGLRLRRIGVVRAFDIELVHNRYDLG